MSLMELMTNVLKNKSNAIIAYIVNTVTIIAFYYLLLDGKKIIYPLVLSMFILLIFLMVEVVKYRIFIDKLMMAKASPDYKCNTLDSSERIIFDTINDLHSEYTHKFYEMYCRGRDKDTLISQWIHNMKTSIAVIDLACEKSFAEQEDKDYLEDITEENNKLKINLEQCLNVLRLEDFSKDYVPEKTNLREMVNSVVNSKKRDFIYRGVYPKVNIDEDIEVYTDKKWCSYMIEQILSNAIKYSRNHEDKRIYITLEKDGDNTILSIKDEGIGIAAEDMPRIFDPFFTGSNGREYTSATGIGLYMVKLISEKLGHKVYVDSKKDEGTNFNIDFLSKM